MHTCFTRFYLYIEMTFSLSLFVHILDQLSHSTKECQMNWISSITNRVSSLLSYMINVNPESIRNWNYTYFLWLKNWTTCATFQFFFFVLFLPFLCTLCIVNGVCITTHKWQKNVTFDTLHLISNAHHTFVCVSTPALPCDFSQFALNSKWTSHVHHRRIKKFPK